MENQTEVTSISSIVVFYIRLDRFKYIINKGKEHICNLEKLKHLIKGLLDDKQLTQLADMLHRTKSFIIFIKDDVTYLKELKPINEVDLTKKKVFNMKKAVRDMRKRKK